MVLAMSEEQLKASAETEVTAQVEDGVEEIFEEISEEDLEGVAGGCPSDTLNLGTTGPHTIIVL